MNKPLRVLSAVLLVSALCGGAFAQISPRMPEPGEGPEGSPVTKYGWLKATGGNLRGSKSGSTDIQLKGLSFFWSNAGDGKSYYNENMVAWLAHDWQIDVVRAAMGTCGSNKAPCSNDEGGGNFGYVDGDSSGQVNLVRAVVDAAIKRGIYVVIDWHSHAAHKYTSYSSKFFSDMVRAYGKYPNVMYEIYNEPRSADGGNWDAVKGYANTVVSAIRSAEANAGVTNANLVIVGSPNWSSEPHQANTSPVTDSKDNTAYSLHFYAGTSAHDSYKNNLTSAKGSNRTVIVTEFGTCDASGNSNYNAGNTSTWLTFLSTNKVSWMNWSITMKNETASVVKPGAGPSGNWTSSNLTTSGELIRGYFPASSNKTYTVTVTQPSEGGTLTRTPASGNIAYGGTVKVAAAPLPGWELETWMGDATGNAAEVSGTVMGVNMSVSARFYNGGLVKNGHFTYGTTPWSAGTGAGAAGSVAIENSQARVNVTTAVAGNPASYRLQHLNVNLTGSKKYKLSYEARAVSGTRSMVTRVSNASGSLVYDSVRVNLTATMAPFERTFDYTRNTDAAAAVAFLCGDQTGSVIIDNVKLQEIGNSTGVAAFPGPVGARQWSVSRVNGALTLRGPVEAGARVSIYDVRGKAVRSMAAKDGLSLGAGVPAGNYFLVVKNRAGGEVYRTNVLMTK